MLISTIYAAKKTYHLHKQ